MTIDEAFIVFANRPDESRPAILPAVVLMERSDDTAIDAWPAMAASFADLSGQLKHATTNEDLDDAVKYGRQLVRMQLLSTRAVRDHAFALMNRLAPPEELPCFDG